MSFSFVLKMNLDISAFASSLYAFPHFFYSLSFSLALSFSLFLYPFLPLLAVLPFLPLRFSTSRIVSHPFILSLSFWLSLSFLSSSPVSSLCSSLTLPLTLLLPFFPSTIFSHLLSYFQFLSPSPSSILFLLFHLPFPGYLNVFLLSFTGYFPLLLPFSFPNSTIFPPTPIRPKTQPSPPPHRSHSLSLLSHYTSHSLF